MYNAKNMNKPNQPRELTYRSGIDYDDFSYALDRLSCEEDAIMAEVLGGFSVLREIQTMEEAQTVLIDSLDSPEQAAEFIRFQTQPSEIEDTYARYHTRLRNRIIRTAGAIADFRLVEWRPGLLLKHHDKRYDFQSRNYNETSTYLHAVVDPNEQKVDIQKRSLTTRGQLPPERHTLLPGPEDETIVSHFAARSLATALNLRAFRTQSPNADVIRFFLAVDS